MIPVAGGSPPLNNSRRVSCLFCFALSNLCSLQEIRKCKLSKMSSLIPTPITANVSTSKLGLAQVSLVSFPCKVQSLVGSGGVFFLHQDCFCPNGGACSWVIRCPSPISRSCGCLRGVRGVCLTHSEGTLHLPPAVAAGPLEAWNPSIEGERSPGGLSLGWGMGSGPSGPQT